MATKSQAIAGMTAGRSSNESLEARRRREAAARAQTLAGLTAGRTTPPKAITASNIGQTWLNATDEHRRGDAMGNPTPSVLNTAPAPADRAVSASSVNDAYTHLTPAVQSATYSNNPTGSGWNAGTTDTIDGYLKQFGYTPQGLMGLYDNPQPLAQDVLGTRGIENSGMSQQLAELFDHFLGAQFVNNRGGSPTDNDTLNFIANAMQQAITPGGQYVDPAYYLNTLLGATNQDANPLGAYLGAGTPEQQISNTNRLASQGLVGMNPYSQNAYASALQRQGDQYLGGTMKGDPNAQSYVDYLRQSPFANWF